MEPSASVTQIAQALGVSDSVLRCWVRLASDGVTELDANKPLRNRDILGRSTPAARIEEGNNGARHPQKAFGYFAKDPG
jgi:transposase-like protein